MWVMTFHSACVRILREQHAKLGFTSTFSIYDQSDAQRLMAQILRLRDLDPKRYPPRQVAAQISNLKNELVDFDTYRSGRPTTPSASWPRSTPPTRPRCSRPTRSTSTT